MLLTDDDVPVLMDFGSMGPARVEIKTRAEARQLQVGYENICITMIRQFAGVLPQFVIFS